MTAVSTTVLAPAGAGAVGARPLGRPTWASALATLARRRLELSARTPRELIIPLLTPVLFAIVIAPALDSTFGAGAGGAGGATVGGVDYMTFVSIATIGLLVPISCMTAGLGVVVDRLGGARRDMLAAPIRRPLVVLGNLAVALLLSGLQVVVLLVCSGLRGADFSVSASGLLWFGAAAMAFAVLMYGIAETVANRTPNQEEYVGTIPAIAIVPWFFGGSLFPISALPAGLTAFAKVLPITHVLALMRYGLVGDPGALEDIWGMSSATGMATLSLAIVAVAAGAITALAVRTFSRMAVQ